MTERAPAEPTIVCPFLAYGEERDFRASVPDHRHRCFADMPAAPRALAHQAAYCLTAAFSTCPTFVDWARRESAPAREVGPAGRTLRDVAAPRGAATPPTGPETRGRYGSVAAGSPPEPSATAPAERLRRTEQSWATPPPWAPTGPEGPDEPEEPSDEYEPSDRYEPSRRRRPPDQYEPSRRREPRDRYEPSTAAEGEAEPEEPYAPDEGEAPPFLAGRVLDDGRPVQYQPVGAAPSRRAPVGHAGMGAEQQTVHERSVDPDAPAWERPRRFEAYPSLRTRGWMRGPRRLPNLAGWAVVVLIAGAALVAVPFLLRGSGGGDAGATPTPVASASAGASVVPSVTPKPAATPFVYTVRSGDILSKIATKYGLTLDQLMKANPQITNANKIKPGDKITIPTPPPGDVVDNGRVTPEP